MNKSVILHTASIDGNPYAEVSACKRELTARI